ncbi:MAG: hypothetical protein R3A48_04200 [Polyangiales bacterium]
MRRTHTALLFTATLTLASLRASADPRLGDRALALGLRGGARVGDYQLGSIGGQVRIRPLDRVSVDLFTDHHLGSERGGGRHDHEIGGTISYDLLRGARWAIHPVLGACGLLAVAHAPQGDFTATDVRFGLRAGLGFEGLLTSRVSLQAQAQAIAYIGHDFGAYTWPRGTEEDVSVRGVAQLHLALNFWL